MQNCHYFVTTDWFFFFTIYVIISLRILRENFKFSKTFVIFPNVWFWCFAHHSLPYFSRFPTILPFSYTVCPLTIGTIPGPGLDFPNRSINSLRFLLSFFPSRLFFLLNWPFFFFSSPLLSSFLPFPSTFIFTPFYFS